MDPGTAAAIGQTVLGAAGTLFGGRRRRRKSASELLAEDALRRQGQLGERASNLALAYDPGVETAEAVRFAQDTAGTTIADAMRRLNQQFRAQGGSPTGDTQFRVNASRTVEDIANPLRQFAAERRAGEAMRRLQMLGIAAGSLQPGQAMNVAQMQHSMRPNTSGAQTLLAGGLDRLLSQRSTSTGDKTGYQIRPPTGQHLQRPAGQRWMHYDPWSAMRPPPPRDMAWRPGGVDHRGRP